MAKQASLKQMKFAIEYLRTGNMYRSARFAGYSHATAKNARVKILNIPSTQAYIKSIGERSDPLEKCIEAMHCLIRGKIQKEQRIYTYG